MKSFNRLLSHFSFAHLKRPKMARLDAFGFSSVALAVVTLTTLAVAILQSPDAQAPWTATLVLLVLALLTWRKWYHKRLFQKSQRLWRLHGDPLRILNLLRRIQEAGEMGYQAHLLASKVWLQLGERERAQRESRQAHMCKEPLPYRLFWLAMWLAKASWTSKNPLQPPAWLQQFHLIKKLEQDSALSETWEAAFELLPKLQDDCLKLEELMLAALKQMQEAREHPSLGSQSWSPAAPRVFEAALLALSQSHGEAQAGWNRLAPAHYLLAQKRYAELLCLCQGSLPLNAALAALVIVALRKMGDLPAASHSVDKALAFHDTSYRLWMERFHTDIALGQFGPALKALKEARLRLGNEVTNENASALWEWQLNRAEFAHWAERDSQKAWHILEKLPDSIQKINPHLRMQVNLSLEHHETAFEEAKKYLEANPGHIDTLLIQGECMAGMEAWEALGPYLEQLPESARQHPSAWHLKGLYLANQKDFQAAREHLERAAQMASQDLTFVLDAGHACMELGEFARSEQHWRQALRLESKNEEALIQLSEAKRGLQDLEGAKRLLRECLLHHPESESAQAYLSELEAH